MKIRQYIAVALVSLSGLMCTSCLDLNPQAEMGDNLVWTSADNFQLFANQFYGWSRDFQLSTTATYGNGYSDGPHSDWRSDLICTSSVNVYSAGTNSIPSTDANYTNLYKRIYYTNLLLDRAKSYGDQSSIASPMGEAYFFRAYLHFELVQIWGDAVLLTEPLDIDSEQLYASRKDRGEVVDQIIDDLRQAAELLPETPSEEGRLCKDAARAMLSRVALYEGTWQKFHNGGAEATSNTTRSTELLAIARDAALEVMEGGRYSLFYNSELGVESYRYMFILEDGVQCNPAGLNKNANTEYIFSHRHRTGDRSGLNITQSVYGGALIITRKLADMYVCSDGLPIDKSPLFQGYVGTTDEFQNRDSRMLTSLIYEGQAHWDNDSYWRVYWTDEDLNSCRTGGSNMNGGYIGHKWAVEREVTDYYEAMDYPVIRYAEVLLNYAEAAYELNGSISDEDLDLSLNLVRHRINPDMPGLSNSLVSSNGLSMREEIRRERTVELFLEGFRIDDLKRWYTAGTEMPEDQIGVHVTGTDNEGVVNGYELDGEGCVLLYGDRTWSERNYLYPLPSDQLQLNPQLGQNPGW